MGGPLGLWKIVLESKKVKFTYISHFYIEFITLRDDISKKMYRNLKKLKS